MHSGYADSMEVGSGRCRSDIWCRRAFALPSPSRQLNRAKAKAKVGDMS